MTVCLLSAKKYPRKKNGRKNSIRKKSELFSVKVTRLEGESGYEQG